MTDFKDDQTLRFAIPKLGEATTPEADITSLGNLVSLQHDLSTEQVQAAVAFQRAHPGMKLGEALVCLGYVTEEAVEQAFSDQSALRDATPTPQRAEVVKQAADKAEERATTLEITMDLYQGWIDQIADKISDKLGKRRGK